MICYFGSRSPFGLLSSQQSHADDWPLVRGDAFGTGIARSSLPNQLEVVWTFSTSKDAGFDATAVVADGVIYVGDSAGTFYALRVADGKPVWTKKFKDSGFLAGAAIDKGSIFVGDDDGIVRCLAASDGSERWNEKLDGEVYAGPTPNGDDILFTCEAGTLACLNEKDGQTKWTFHIEAPLRCTPTISNGRVVLAGCDSRLHLINVADGKETDSVEIDGPTGSTPAMRDQRVFFGTEGGTFFAIQIPSAAGEKASVAWKYQDAKRSQPIRTAAAVSDRLIVYGSQGKAIYGLEPATGAEKWKLPTRSRVESSPVIAGDRVIVATTTGKIYVLGTATGDVKWEYDAGGGFTASPAVVDGRIILGNTDGTLYCFGAKDKTRKLTTEVTEDAEKKLDNSK